MKTGYKKISAEDLNFFNSFLDEKGILNIGGKKTLKVVCGAPNARDGLVTIYAPPGAIIPKTKLQLNYRMH